MALLGEEVVEEWLNRQGYFTIRGIKLGVHEIDILAVKPSPHGTCECRHVEVHVSINPVSYICSLPKDLLGKGQGAGSAKKRTPEELKHCIEKWIKKKFDHPKKAMLRQQLSSGEWSREFVVHKVKHPEELEAIAEAGIRIIHFKKIVEELADGRTLVPSAAGGDLFNLMQLGKETPAK